MSIPATVRAMRAAGVGDSQIVDTVLAMAEEALAKGRARQAKYRNNNDIGDVTNVNNVSDVTNPSPEQKPPTPQKTQTPTLPPPVSPTGKPAPPSRGRALPADWRPSEQFWRWAAEKGHSRDVCDQSLEEMREWADANRNRQIARKADWCSALKGWVRKAAKNRKGTDPPKNDLMSASRRNIERMANL